MNFFSSLTTLVALSFVMVACYPTTNTPPENPPVAQNMPKSIANLIVKPTIAAGQSNIKLNTSFMNELSQTAGISLLYSHPIAAGTHVIKTQSPITSSQLTDIIQKLTARSDVEYAELDSMRQIQ